MKPINIHLARGEKSQTLQPVPLGTVEADVGKSLKDQTVRQWAGLEHRAHDHQLSAKRQGEGASVVISGEFPAPHGQDTE